MLWVLIGWQFTLAEYVGGLVMIALMWALLRLFVSRRDEEEAREHAQRRRRRPPAPRRRHASCRWRERLTSADAWSDVAHNFRGDWQMLWKEITLGFLLAGFIALLGDDFFNGLFLDDAPGGRPDDVGRAHRPGHRRAELRLLGRQRPAGRRAVVGRHLASPA